MFKSQLNVTEIQQTAWGNHFARLVSAQVASRNQENANNIYTNSREK